MNNINHRLTNFTDILNEEIEDSQPMSLPSSNKSICSSQENNLNSDLVDAKTRRPERYTGQRGNFRSREEIDQKYRDVFSHNYFNLVQSRIMDDALYSDKSLVVCAPTGSGKTVVFEMAIVQLLMEIEDKNCDQDFKIIYMAPVKALCSERLSEWYPKFTKLGLLCIEVTGDTDVDFPQLKPYRLIITTPEKWDMLTRRWTDHSSLVEVIKLFLIDEVHILNDELRGPVLEAVVSRMKTIESSVQSVHRITKLQRQYQNTEDILNIETPAPRIRFIAVSATVSNPEDVAKWLGTADRPAVFYKFGDEYRPVKLKLLVEGYPCAEGSSIFKFDIVLNYKLWPIIQKYYNGKPTLIFCNTRKSVALTAETLSREITVGFSDEQKARLTALAATIHNKKFQSLILCGVGCHHAGLLYEERINIENAFRNRDLPILITTTTLAMGVNLPAHLVIIKNTQQYVNGAYQEYSISTILQMVGRAGRPQFDTEATAVIMTRLGDKVRYQSLLGGSEPLQSYLHKRIAENLNSEAALGTVTDVAQCVQWLNSTFLSVRAARDPRRYLGLPQNASQQLISKKIEELCVKAMNGLASSGLITMDEACCIQSTDAGRLMSVYYIYLGTMKTIMKIDGTESLERLLWLVCESHELADMHLRVDERRCLNALNRNNAAATVRFPMKGKISTRQMKLYCIIQAVLGCLPIPEPSLNQEAMKVMRIADRVCKCLVAYVTSPKLMCSNPKNYAAVLNSLVLAKCVSAHLWENSPYLSKQLKGIGPTFSSLLASAGKVNFMLLEESHPRDLERIMNKGPPAGNIIRKQISLLPKYSLKITPLNEQSVRIELTLLNQAFLSENLEHLTAGGNHKFYLVVGDSENNLLYLSSFKDTDLLNIYDGCITCDVTRKQNNEHKVMAHCISSNFVGIDDNCEFLFRDLSACTHKEINVSFDEIQMNEHPNKQVPDTDNLKKRKRKNDSDIVQSKEKIKRDTNIIKKFNNLKESLRVTSKHFMKNLNKTTEMSNNILYSLNKPGSNINDDEENLPAMEQKGNNHDDTVIEISDGEDNVDDTEINKILNEIEGEIKQVTVNNPTSSTMHDIQNKAIEKIKNCSDHRMNTALLNSTKPQKGNPASSKNKIFKCKQKEKNTNFSFIDLIEKKNNLASDNVVETESETGFSGAIRDHINEFLKKAQLKNQTNTTINELISSPVTKNIGCSSHNIVSEVATKNINRNNNNIANIISRKNVPSKHGDINFTKTQNVLLNNAIVSNENTGSYKEKTDVFKNSDTLTTEIAHGYSNLLDDRVIYEPIFSNTINANENHSIQSYNENRCNLNSALNVVSKAEPDSVGTLKNYSLVPVQNEGKLPSITTHNMVNSHDKYQNSESHLSMCLNPDENIKQANSLNTFYCGTSNNTQDNKFKEFINKFSYSATKINTCTKMLPDCRIQIVSRLKVDLNVTEIKTQNDTRNKNTFKNSTNSDTDDNSNNCNIEIKEIISPKSRQEKKIIDENKQLISEKNECPQVEYKKDTVYDDDVEDHSKTNNLNVNDILLKYKNKVDLRKNNTSPVVKLNDSINCNFNGESRKSLSKPKRQYKISDLHKINMPLPESLSSSIADTKTSFVDISNKVKQVNQLFKNAEKQEITKVDHASETPEINCDLHDDLRDSPIPIDIDDHQNDFNISEAILNPKTLLESVQNEIELFPPPPEFCDDNTYSPISVDVGVDNYDANDEGYANFYTTNEQEIVNTFASQDFESNEYDCDSSMDISQPKALETWTLSTEDDKHLDSTYKPYYQYSNFTTRSQNNLTQIRSQRHEKLNKFRFTRNSDFKLKKKN